MRVDLSRKTYLDVLKFISCIVVYLCHFRMSFCYNRFGNFEMGKIQIPNLLIDGNLAVCIFLAVSNFIYLSKGMKYADSDYSLKVKKDILSRYIRLFVPAAVVNLVILVFYKFGLFWNLDAVPVNYPDTASWFNIGNHSVLKVLYSTANLCLFPGINPPLWCYYLLFLQPLLILLLVPVYRTIDKRVCSAVCMVLAVLLSLRNSYWTAIPLCLLMGFWENTKVIFRFIFTVVLVALKIAVISFGFSKYVTGVNLFLAALIVWLFDGLHSKNDNTNVWGGAFAPNEISFSVYLLHMVCVCSVGFYFLENVTQNVGVVFLATTVVLVAVSIPFHVFVEKKLSGWVLDRIMKIFGKSQIVVKQNEV